jgi:hypothetical protein
MEVRPLWQKCLSFDPNAPHEIADRFGSGEGGALSRPSRNALNIVRVLAGLPHRAGKTSLNGIGSRLGGFRRVSLTNVTGFDRAGESATEGSCHRRSFGLNHRTIKASASDLGSLFRDEWRLDTGFVCCCFSAGKSSAVKATSKGVSLETSGAP